jgi:hypothetical protein
MTTTFDRVTIEVLDSKDRFPGWMIKMQDILEEINLWEYAGGYTTRPRVVTKQAREADADFQARQATNGQDILDWEKHDRKAMRAIRFRLSNDLVKRFVGAKTSYELMTMIRDHFKPHGALGPVILKRNMSQARYSDGEDMSKHIDNLQMIAFDLDSLGHPMPDEEFNSVLLLSLPESWDSVVSGLDDTILTNRTQLTHRLMAEAERRAHRNNNSGNTSSQAFQTRTNNSRRPGKRRSGNPNVVCHHCGIKGHYSKHCQKRLRGDPQSEAGKAARNQSHTSRANTATDYGFAILSEADITPSALVAQANTTTPWLADSAASSHFCTDRAMFKDFTPVKESAGGYTGKAPIKGRGTVMLRLKLNDGTIHEIGLRNTVFCP